MAVNKVVFDGEPIIDLTGDSVTADSLLEGVTAHNAAGEAIVGTYTASEGGETEMQFWGDVSALANAGVDLNAATYFGESAAVTLELGEVWGALSGNMAELHCVYGMPGSPLDTSSWETGSTGAAVLDTGALLMGIEVGTPLAPVITAVPQFFPVFYAGSYYTVLDGAATPVSGFLPMTAMMMYDSSANYMDVYVYPEPGYMYNPDGNGMIIVDLRYMAEGQA